MRDDYTYTVLNAADRMEIEEYRAKKRRQQGILQESINRVRKSQNEVDFELAKRNKEGSIKSAVSNSSIPSSWANYLRIYDRDASNAYQKRIFENEQKAIDNENKSVLKSGSISKIPASWSNYRRLMGL